MIFSDALAAGAVDADPAPISRWLQPPMSWPRLAPNGYGWNHFFRDPRRPGYLDPFGVLDSLFSLRCRCVERVREGASPHSKPHRSRRPAYVLSCNGASPPRLALFAVVKVPRRSAAHRGPTLCATATGEIQVLSAPLLPVVVFRQVELVITQTVDRNSSPYLLLRRGPACSVD